MALRDFFGEPAAGAVIPIPGGFPELLPTPPPSPDILVGVLIAIEPVLRADGHGELADTISDLTKPFTHPVMVIKHAG